MPSFSRAYSTSFASFSRFILVLPQVGQETRFTLSFLSPIEYKISFAKRTSSIGSAVSDTLMVSPTPDKIRDPSPTADLSLPDLTVPDSVMPICMG